MSLVEKNIIDYINEVDSLLPAPGGGSVAALVGALGVALGKMLGHFSIKKKIKIKIILILKMHIILISKMMGV